MLQHFLYSDVETMRLKFLEQEALREENTALRAELERLREALEILKGGDKPARSNR
jgi:FtsZ-binding cell division protein ZapB